VNRQQTRWALLLGGGHCDCGRAVLAMGGTGGTVMENRPARLHQRETEPLWTGD
jgi:hypothetical protein